MKAHQRVIREAKASQSPRPIVPLDQCFVRQITAAEAKPIILEYEWLGTMNRPVICYGLDSPEGLVGVACFGYANGTKSHDLCGEEHRDKAICLERGTCVHYAHPHAGSKLVAGACRQLAQDTDFRIVFAYSDAAAGEIGTIYQACNWLYLGQSPGRKGNYRWKVKHLPTGKEWSTRALRSYLKDRDYGIADLRNHPDWEFRKEYDKGKYVTFVGNKRERKWYRGLLRYPTLPYPKR